MKHDYEEPPRIGHREDALALLEEMIAHCEESKDGYFWPRLEALRDAIARWVI